MEMAVEVSPKDIVPQETVRAALRRAITERNVVNGQYRHLETAEMLARELCSASERVLHAFSDVDAAIVQHWAGEFRRAATDGSSPRPDLPDSITARRGMRETAFKLVAAARATHLNLAAHLNLAESMRRQSGLNIAVAALNVLMAEAATQGAALKAAWEEVWRQFDRLSALADCRLHYAEASIPVTLPLEIVSLLQTIAAPDGRHFPDGCNDVAAKAGEGWCSWFKSLLTDPEAEVMFDHNEQGAQLRLATSSRIERQDRQFDGAAAPQSH